MSADEQDRLKIAQAASCLVTIECSRGNDSYTLFKSGTHLDVHLAGPGKTGGTGAILCGFDRFQRGPDGHGIVGFSVGGGVTGPGYHHHPCLKCTALAGDRTITGTHKALFDRAPVRAGGDQ